MSIYMQAYVICDRCARERPALLPVAHGAVSMPPISTQAWKASGLSVEGWSFGLVATLCEDCSQVTTQDATATPVAQNGMVTL